MNVNNSIETGTDISLDYYKELKLNYNDKYGSLVEELKNKYSTSNTNGYEKNSGTSTNDNFSGNNSNKIQTIENMKNKQTLKVNTLKLENSRFDKFMKIKQLFAKKRLNMSESVKNIKTSKMQMNNNNKYGKVLKEVSDLLNNLEMLKTKSTFHKITVKDSFLNSHKNFIIINQLAKFQNGIPVLQLKKEAFLKNKLPKVIKFFFNVFC
jgi:hypothetical protein